MHFAIRHVFKYLRGRGSRHNWHSIVLKMVHWSGLRGGVSWWMLGVLLSCLRPLYCKQFNLTWSHPSGASQNLTALVTVNLGDIVTVHCPSYRYDNIVYLHSADQLKQCNATVIPDQPSFIDVGSCAGTSTSFNITVRRTSGFLASSVPFMKGETYYFTSFTDGTAASAAAMPTAGGDCEKGLSMIIEVLDPSSTAPLPTTTPMDTPTSEIPTPVVEGLSSALHVHDVSIATIISLFILTVLALLSI